MTDQIRTIYETIARSSLPRQVAAIECMHNQGAGAYTTATWLSMPLGDALKYALERRTAIPGRIPADSTEVRLIQSPFFAIRSLYTLACRSVDVPTGQSYRVFDQNTTVPQQVNAILQNIGPGPSFQTIHDYLISQNTPGITDLDDTYHYCLRHTTSSSNFFLDHAVATATVHTDLKTDTRIGCTIFFESHVNPFDFQAVEESTKLAQELATKTPSQVPLASRFPRRPS